MNISQSQNRIIYNNILLINNFNYLLIATKNRLYLNNPHELRILILFNLNATLFIYTVNDA